MSDFLKPVGGIVFRIPGLPGCKQRARSFRLPDGRIRQYTPKETVRYENLVAVSFQQAAPPGFAPHLGPVSLSVIARFPIPATWPRWRKALASAETLFCPKYKDWDNIGKVVSDALNHIAYRDDRQICTANVRKVFDASPGVEIALAFYPEPRRGQAEDET